MLNHTLHHIYKVLCMVVYFLTRATSRTLLICLAFTFCGLLRRLRYTRLRHSASHEIISFFHPHLSWLGGFCIGIIDWAQPNAAWYMALGTCCFNEYCVRGKFLSCRLYWGKSCHLHLFTSYLVDAAWYIKQTNLSMVFSSLSMITTAVELLHSYTKLSVNCG